MTEQELNEKQIVETNGGIYTPELSQAIAKLNPIDRTGYVERFVQNNLDMVARGEIYPYPVGWDFDEILDAAGTIDRHVYRDSDAENLKLLEGWSHFIDKLGPIED